VSPIVQKRHCPMEVNLFAPFCFETVATDKIILSIDPAKSKQDTIRRTHRSLRPQRHHYASALLQEHFTSMICSLLSSTFSRRTP
jgi:hypothetical protein